MSERWKSRKFITTLAAQLAAVAVLFMPQHEEAITQAAQTIAALTVLLLGALGYTLAEASIDRAPHRAKRPRSALPHRRARRYS